MNVPSFTSMKGELETFHFSWIVSFVLIIN